MLKASVQLVRNAYGGLPPQMWWQALVTLVNRSGTMVLPFLTVYMTHLGYSITEAGWVMGAFGAGALLGTFLGGRLTDRIGFLRVQFFSLLLSGFFFIGLSFIHGLPYIILFVFILSIIGEAYRPANSAAIAAYSDVGTRTRSYTLNRLAVNLGWSVGPAVGGLLASISYSLLFWADGLTCIAAAMLLYGTLKGKEPQPVEKSTAVPGMAGSPYRDKLFLAGMFYLLVVVVVFFQMIAILPVYFKEEAGLSERQIGGVLALNGLVITLTEMLLVYGLEKLGGNRRYLIAGALSVGISFLMHSFGTSLGLIIGSILLITIGEMLLFPFINNFWVNRSNDQNRGAYAALFSMIFALSHIIAPAFATQVVQRFGYTTLWKTDLVLCLLAAIGFSFLPRKPITE